MLTTFFLICAVVGGAIVVAQLLLGALALGAGHGLHLHHKVGGSISPHRGILRGIHQPRGGMRASAPRAIRAGGGAKGGVKAGLKPSAAPKPGAAQRPAAGVVSSHWPMAWVLGMFNFQGIVAGATVFGLVGLAVSAARKPGSVAVGFGIGAAIVMMALVSALLAMMTGLDKDATVDIQQAVGKLATVYLGVPAKNEGRGKITVSLQGRLMEFPAATFQDEPLVTGSKVNIVSVLDPDVMLVVLAENDAPDLQN